LRREQGEITLRMSDGDGAKAFHHYDPKFSNLKRFDFSGSGEKYASG
jgi:hypothetical protein